ncbi:hypothetical protein Vretifemale_15261 [Volvox reticuliferus]|uniref:Uncharacterized protein n=1 Tax=Volvox reticuliferus TaxID=1737510 RepID=A0A8J4CUX4_9CHLO|nr:hypothetical protein Vretifemale_15261 [Volvox reticuliferus]
MALLVPVGRGRCIPTRAGGCGRLALRRPFSYSDHSVGHVCDASPPPLPPSPPYVTAGAPSPYRALGTSLNSVNQCNTGAQDATRLGVQVSSNVPRSNSISEVHRLHVTDFSQAPTLTVRYLYASLMALDGVRVTVAAGPGGGEMLTDPRVGLRLGFGNSMNVVVPLTLDGAELALRLAAAFGTTAGGSALSVRRSVNGTAVTLEVAAAAEGAVPALFDVASAAVVELPMPPPRCHRYNHRRQHWR